MTTDSDPLAVLSAAQAAFNDKSAAAPVPDQFLQPWTQEIIQFLVLSLLAFTTVALILSTALLWRSHAAAPQILRIFGVISIISISALLLIVGYSNEQLTPIVGLFGAIAGYLLGKDSNVDKP